ncbi:MAG: DUF523 domain-containing protein [Christensenellales bacterium]|jgi:uncharacterized protein YbbK (DUF523 family)
MVLVSACLAGYECRYDGGANPVDTYINMVKEGHAIAVCPEKLAGMKIPREPVEIIGGDGHDVLRGKAKVVTLEGCDRTFEMILSAEKTLQICRWYGIKKAYLKSKSPSCGAGKIYDGSFGSKLVDGYGVIAAILKENDVEVIEVE